MRIGDIGVGDWIRFVHENGKIEIRQVEYVMLHRNRFVIGTTDGLVGVDRIIEYRRRAENEKKETTHKETIRSWGI